MCRLPQSSPVAASEPVQRRASLKNRQNSYTVMCCQPHIVISINRTSLQIFNFTESLCFLKCMKLQWCADYAFDVPWVPNCGETTAGYTALAVLHCDFFAPKQAKE